MLARESLLSLIALGTVAFGCSKKVPECNAFIKQLNDTSTAMQTATSAMSTDPKQAAEALNKIAATSKAETNKLANVELTVPELRGFSTSYQALLKETAAAASSMARATAEFQDVEATVVKDRSAWVAASSKLQIACKKARGACAAFGEKLTRPPFVTGIDPEADAKKLDEYAKDIESLELENSAVKAAVEELRQGVVSFVAVLRRLSSAKQEHEKATKSLAAAGAKEPALVKSINDFCQAG